MHTYYLIQAHKPIVMWLTYYLHKLILEWTTQYFMSHGMMLLHFVSGLVKDSQLKLSGNMPAKQDSKTSKIE